MSLIKVVKNIGSKKDFGIEFTTEANEYTVARLLDAKSNDIQGLVAQGRTISETMEIARDVCKKLIESQNLTNNNVEILKDSFDYPLVISF